MNQKEKTLQFWTLNIASFLAQTGFVIINLAFVYYFSSLKLTPSSIGMAFALYNFSYLISCLSFGRFYQRYKPRYMVLSSLLLTSLFVFLITVFTNYLTILLLMLSYGFSMSMIWPQMEAWITRDREGDELNKATTGFNLSWSLASGLSTYIGAEFISRGALIGLYSGIASLLIAAFVLIVVSALVPAIRAVKGEGVEVHETEVKDNSTPLRFNSWIGVGAIYIVLAIMNNVFPLYGKTLGFDARIVGLLLLVRGMATFFCFIYLGKTSYWQFNFNMILLTQLVLAVACLFCVLFSSFFFYILAFFLFGLLVAFMYNFSIFHSATGAVNRNSRMIIHEVMVNGGSTVGSLIGGGTYEFLGYPWLMTFLFFILLILVIFQAFFRKRKLIRLYNKN